MATIDLTFTPCALPGPAPALRPAEVHIWRIDLDGASFADDALSAEEEARAARMKHDGARMTFRRTRTALRLILAAYEGADPAHLPIVIDGRGKPRLEAPDAPHFNASHSGATALIAVTRAGPVGVDLEMVRPAARLDSVAERFFAPAEARALASLPEADRDDAFFACWTRKEAFVKAEGSGIANALSGFEVSVAPEHPARILTIGGDPKRALSWTLHAFRPLPAAWGAVCIAAPGVEARGFDFQMR